MEKAMSYKTHANGNRESHSGIVPTKQPNESQGGPKEVVEARPLTKENTCNGPRYSRLSSHNVPRLVSHCRRWRGDS